MASQLKIGTHNGTFHCDDVLACFMLKCLPAYESAAIIRSRTPDVLKDCDIVVDVGGVFNHGQKKYDHHQRDFNATFNSIVPEKLWTTKLSSAGLVYVHYGRDVIRAIAGQGQNLTDTDVEIIYDKVYENFVEEIDAVDNGISPYDGQPRYLVKTTLSERVKHLNPSWNEESSEDILLKKFYDAMEVVGSEFRDRVTYYRTSFIPARELVLKAMREREKLDKSGEIIVLDAGGMPWKEHLFELENQLQISNTIKYVLYGDTSGKWRVQCVPIRPDSFQNRLSLPQSWCGLRDEQLSEVSGINGCIFVHMNGFIGGNHTYEGALTMASRSLQLSREGSVN